MFQGLDVGLSTIYFLLFGAATAACALGVLCSRHPLNATICLIGTMLAISGIYALLASPFLGVVQVLVYAGAIMMLVIFVIMVLNRARDHEVPRIENWSYAVLLVPVLLFASFVHALTAMPAETLKSDPGSLRGDIAPIAKSMFDVNQGHGYWLLFECIGVLLLVAVVGAVLLAKRSLDTPVAMLPVGEEAHDSH